MHGPHMSLGLWEIEKWKIRYSANKSGKLDTEDFWCLSHHLFTIPQFFPTLCGITKKKMWKWNFLHLYLLLKTPSSSSPPLFSLLSLPFSVSSSLCLFSLILLDRITGSLCSLNYSCYSDEHYSYSLKEAYFSLSFPTIKLIEHNGNVTDNCPGNRSHYNYM